MVPPEFREALGARVYGCDTCQQVCPRNADVTPKTPDFTQDVFPGPAPLLADLIELSKADFERTVKPSSIGWIGRNRIRRNAIVAAGNLGVRELLPVLERVARDTSPVISESAQWAIRRFRD